MSRRLKGQPITRDQVQQLSQERQDAKKRALEAEVNNWVDRISGHLAKKGFCTWSIDEDVAPEVSVRVGEVFHAVGIGVRFVSAPDGGGMKMVHRIEAEPLPDYIQHPAGAR